MFEQMEISEQVYEVKSPSRKIIMEDTNHDSNVRKRKGGESISPTDPEKGRAGTGHPSDAPTRAKKTCLLHGPGYLRSINGNYQVIILNF